jgi:hypothetical protein
MNVDYVPQVPVVYGWDRYETGICYAVGCSITEDLAKELVDSGLANLVEDKPKKKKVKRSDG